MAAAPFALIHSPLTGPLCWRGVEKALVASGHGASALDYGGVVGPRWYETAAERIAAALHRLLEPAVLVLHSGAGALAPAIVAAARPKPVAIVFVDALLPHPGKSWLEIAPPLLARRLRDMAIDGVAPPWNEWFAQDPCVLLIGDNAVRRDFVDELPSVPMAYLQARAPSPLGWHGIPTAYLQLSDAYEPQAREAARRGWRVGRGRLHHLALVTDPVTVAGLLEELSPA